MKKQHLFKVLSLCLLFGNCSGQTSRQGNKKVGGGCDGCELMYVGMPEKILPVDTSPGWNEPGQPLIITGTVFHPGGKTPARDVVIYYWQTDNKGYYSPKPGMDERARRHGHIRGWVKTDANGNYTIRTIRPAPYPGENMPAHIHLSVKEPDIADEYYTDEINFDDDKYLIPHFKKYPQENRGGSGVVRVLLKGNVQIAEHNIVLGLNIPDYPRKIKVKTSSGLNIGEDQPSFMPYHAFGPDKGSQACPVCKYGRYHGIIYYVGDRPDWDEIRQWLRFLEEESVQRKKYLKVYFVYGNSIGYHKKERQEQLEALGRELGIRHSALTFVPSFTDKATEAHLNRVNPEAVNTFIIYKHRSIVDKYIDLKPGKENFSRISSSLDRTRGDHFDLPEPRHD